MYSRTHKFVMKNAVAIVSRNPLNPEFKKEVLRYKDIMQRGNVEEDRICKLKAVKVPIPALGMSHFYHPHLKKGQFFDLFDNALNVGVKRYNKAKEEYLRGNLEDAYFNLGGALHFIADCATPVHIHLEQHAYFDRFERYLNNNFKKINIDDAKIIKHKKIEDYYHNIAITAFRCRADSTLNFFRWLPYIVGNKKRLTREEIRRQTEFLLPLTISYTAGLLEHFFEEIEREKLILVKN